MYNNLWALLEIFFVTLLNKYVQKINMLLHIYSYINNKLFGQLENLTYFYITSNGCYLSNDRNLDY